MLNDCKFDDCVDDIYPAEHEIQDATIKVKSPYILTYIQQLTTSVFWEQTITTEEMIEASEL